MARRLFDADWNDILRLEKQKESVGAFERKTVTLFRHILFWSCVKCIEVLRREKVDEKVMLQFRPF